MKIDRLIATIQANRTFIIAYTVLLFIGMYPLLAWDKIQVVLMVNKYHHPLIDRFFFYGTHVGNGITYILMLVVLFFCKTSPRKLLIGLTSFGAMSMIIQILKRVVFPHHLRPIQAIQLANEAVKLHLVDNVEVLTHLSFPSGHAGTIFTAACFLNLIGGHKYHWYSFGLLFTAILVAYSRVYLCQHFYTDVYAGALIGGWTTLIVYIFLVDFPMPQWLTSKLPDKL